MKALVTGGAGFIGSNLVDALLERGDEVVIVDDLSTGRHDNVAAALQNGAELVVEDIADAKIVGSLIAERKPDTIFHLAAQIDVRVSVAQPALDAGINVLGTINMLESARAAGVGRFVYASTGGALYGEADPAQLPCGEDTPIKPEAPYGQAKYAGEGYLALAARLHDQSTISLRFGNVYGPRQDPLGEAGVIAIFCGRLLEGKRPTVFGDGKQTRDYIYVGDVVEAMLAAAGSRALGSFNIGCGIETSVLDLVEALGALGSELGIVADGAFEPEFAPPRPGEVSRNALDPALAREQLGFEAAVDLSDGLRQTLESLR